jgi:hypothetical protein
MLPLPRAMVSRISATGAALALAAIVAAGTFSGAAAASAPRTSAGGPTWSALTPIGSSLMLAAVSCPTSTFCAIANGGDAKNDAGTMYTLSGTTLSAPTVISRYDGSPDSVSCPSSQFCVAIDNAGSVYTFNGKAWSKPEEIDDIPPANQTAVSCASSTFCAAIDDSGDVETFNGASWTKSSQIDPGGGGYKAQNCASNQEGTCAAPAAISCPSSNLCVAVDGTGSVFTFNGSSWSAPAVLDGQTPIVALSCAPASSFCVAIDAGGDAATFNGTSWSAPALVGASGLSSVSCSSSSSCVAVDGRGNEISFDGMGWSTPVAIARSALAAVSCASSSFCLALNAKSDVLTLGSADDFPQAPPKLHTSKATVHRDRFLYLSLSCPRGPRDCDEKLSVYIKGVKTPIVVANMLLGAGYPRTERLFFTKARFAQLLETEGHRFTATVSAGTDPSIGKLTLTLR